MGDLIFRLMWLGLLLWIWHGFPRSSSPGMWLFMLVATVIQVIFTVYAYARWKDRVRAARLNNTQEDQKNDA